MNCQDCKYSEQAFGGLFCMAQKGMPQTTEFNVCGSWTSGAVTNYDRIINKTPEEMALWLSDIAEWLPQYAGKSHAILKWLKQEADE